MITKVELKSYALEQGLKVHDAPKSRQLMKSWDPDWIRHWNQPDLAVVVSFGYFMPHHVLNQFKLGAINVHPSLLPQYRGAAPIHRSILNGDSETGISIIELDRKRFDAGKILKQTVYAIPNHEHILYHDLYSQLAKMGGQELVDVVLNLNEYQKNATTQEESKVTKASKLTKDVAIAYWSKHTAKELYQIHRAIGYRFPLQTKFRGVSVQLLDPSPCSLSFDMNENLPDPGSLYIHEQENDAILPDLYIKTVDSWIRVSKLKFFGKTPIGVKDFINGYRPKSLKDRFENDNANVDRL